MRLIDHKSIATPLTYLHAATFGTEDRAERDAFVNRYNHMENGMYKILATPYHDEKALYLAEVLLRMPLKTRGENVMKILDREAFNFLQGMQDISQQQERG